MPSNQKIPNSPPKSPKIVLAGGGSGGHITPLLSLGHALKRRAPLSRVIYVGLRGEKLAGLEQRLKIFDEHYQVSSGKLRRYHGQSLASKVFDFKTLALNFFDLFKLAAGYFQANRLLRRLRPDVVLSKGGYAAVPTGLAAHRLRIPIVTHDSDAVPGLANRVIGRRAALHATAYPPEFYADYYAPEAVRFTGIPLDERLKKVGSDLRVKYKKMLGIPQRSFVLLTSGGGLGSKTLNQKTLALAPDFLEDSGHYILHFCGSTHVDDVEAEYERILTPQQLSRVKVLGFSPDFYIYTGAADVVITRAGATTLAELAAQAKPCIVIPADFLSGGHQSRNLEVLAQKQAIIAQDDAVKPQNLLRIIRQLEQNHHLRAELGQNLGSLIRSDGADRLAQLILGFKA